MQILKSMHEEFFFLAILVMAQLWVQLGDGWSLLPANPVPFTSASLPVLSVSERGMWDQGSQWQDQGSEGWDLGLHSPGIRDHKSWDYDQQFSKGLVRDQAVPFLWDQGPT